MKITTKHYPANLSIFVDTDDGTCDAYRHYNISTDGSYEFTLNENIWGVIDELREHGVKIEGEELEGLKFDLMIYFDGRSEEDWIDL